MLRIDSPRIELDYEHHTIERVPNTKSKKPKEQSRTKTSLALVEQLDYTQSTPDRQYLMSNSSLKMAGPSFQRTLKKE